MERHKSMRFFVNLSMFNKMPTGVGVYCKKLYDKFGEHKLNVDVEYLFMKEGHFLALRRYLWNLLVLPVRIGRALVYSPSTHGSLFTRNQIVTIHDLISLNFPQQHRLQYYYFKYFVPLLICRCKKVIAISQFTKDQIMKYYNVQQDKIQVVYNGVERLIYHNQPEYEIEVLRLTEGKPFFVCVGASFEHKNILNLIESIKVFNNTDYKFVILGKQNAYFQRVIELSKKYALNNVVFLNYVPTELLLSLYKKAVANIYISLYEGFGFPPLEAAGLGTITLVSDIPIMKEVYGDAVIYVDGENPIAIASKMRQLSENSIDIDFHLSKAEKLFEKYTWENCFAEIYEIVKKEI
ncbi:glycosyltransferase family 4 protein [Sphingobacterium sp. UBA6308]|uniref:glycosyltransferase family 4 protein n=1 Tax=Sphingobacterium sp. UBA6308 TaxID=1947508 RepID=UPI00257BE276|nr:glycosyltransferase family 1 protein [Sphingobacterium sp. UBA6308]